MDRSYELVNDLIEMVRQNASSSCVDITYKNNNIYMNTIKYNKGITVTAEEIMCENMKILREAPSYLFLINSLIYKSAFVNDDPRINYSCLWFNVIKNLNMERDYEITFNDIKSFKETINFNGYTYKMVHCMVFDGTNPRFKILNFKENQKYPYSEFIDNKYDLLKVFNGENYERFQPVNGTIDAIDKENYVILYVKVSQNPIVSVASSTSGSFNFPMASSVTKPPTFGTTPTPTSGSFNFPMASGVTKPPTFGTTPTPTSGSFNFPMAGSATKPPTGSFNLSPVKTEKKGVNKKKSKKKNLKKIIRKIKMKKIKIIKKK